MIPRLFYYPAFLLVTVSLSGCGTVDDDRQANRLFVEAYRLTEAAYNYETEDPFRAYDTYKEAVRNIDRIISDHPGTAVAVDVTQRRTRIGDMTIGELREKVPRLAARTRALEDYHNLALYLAAMGSEEAHFFMTLDHARRLHDRDKADRHTELVEELSDRAGRHWNRELSDRFYHGLSTHFADLSRWEESLRYTDLIQDHLLLSDALHHVLRQGFVASAPISLLRRVTLYLDYMDAVPRISLTDRLADGMLTAGYRPLAVALLEKGIPQPSGSGDLDHLNMLARLAATLAGHGEYDLSTYVIEMIGNHDPDYADFARRDLAAAMAAGGEPDRGMALAETFARDYFRHTALSSIALVRAETDRLEAGLQLLAKVPDTMAEKTDALLRIARMANDREELADSLLGVSYPRIDSVEAPMLRIMLYIQAADVHIQRNRRSLAAGTMEEAETYVAAISGPENINQTVSAAIRTWLSLGRPDRALDIAAWFRMDHPSFETKALELFAHAISLGYHDFARTLAGTTDRRAYFQYLLVSVYLDQEMISQPSELAYEIRDFYWRSRAFSLLVSDLKEKVNRATAVRATTEALRNTQRIRDRQNKQEALFLAASLFASAGMAMDEEHRSLVIGLLGQLDR